MGALDKPHAAVGIHALTNKGHLKLLAQVHGKADAIADLGQPPHEQPQMARWAVTTERRSLLEEMERIPYTE